MVNSITARYVIDDILLQSSVILVYVALVNFGNSEGVGRLRQCR